MRLFWGDENAEDDAADYPEDKDAFDETDDSELPEDGDLEDPEDDENNGSDGDPTTYDISADYPKEEDGEEANDTELSEDDEKDSTETTDFTEVDGNNEDGLGEDDQNNEADHLIEEDHYPEIENDVVTGNKNSYYTYISLTTLLTHTVAHSTKPSSMPITNNQPPKTFLSLALSCHIWQNSDFQSQFAMSKIIGILPNFFT